ncbi:MAG: hypothetical protein KKB51_04705 [Candidatus Riflebacteria bacterium]|nr:hypothetical protein [Candidatus Riflebacteria bacterium]
MKSRLFALFVCLLATATLIGCFGSSSDDTVVTASTATITGTVLESVTNTAIVGATVTDGTNTATSATGGTFTLSNVAVGSGKIMLTVEHSGHLDGYAVEPVTAGNITASVIYLVDKTGAEAKTATNLAVASEALTFPSTVKIELDQNSVVDAAGNPVAAPVVSVIYNAPPKTAAVMDAFPGVFAGTPTDGTTEVPFETFGFVNVDLGAGNQLAAGKPATLTMPIDPAVSAVAPATIPLWSFNVATGKWVQEGTATKVGTNYVAYPVTHFSWYNLDAPINNVSRMDVTVASYVSTLNEWEVAEGMAVDTDRTDLTKRVAGARVVVTATALNAVDGQWGTQAYDSVDNFSWREVKQTNSSGVASFNIPAGRKFSIKVTTSTGEKSGYMYEVVNSVATAYINMGSFATHGDTQAVNNR